MNMAMSMYIYCLWISIRSIKKLGDCYYWKLAWKYLQFQFGNHSSQRVYGVQYQIFSLFLCLIIWGLWHWKHIPQDLQFLKQKFTEFYKLYMNRNLWSSKRSLHSTAVQLLLSGWIIARCWHFLRMKSCIVVGSKWPCIYRSRHTG